MCVCVCVCACLCTCTHALWTIVRIIRVLMNWLYFQGFLWMRYWTWGTYPRSKYKFFICAPLSRSEYECMCADICVLFSVFVTMYQITRHYSDWLTTCPSVSLAVSCLWLFSVSTVYHNLFFCSLLVIVFLCPFLSLSSPLSPSSPLLSITMLQ